MRSGRGSRSGRTATSPSSRSTRRWRWSAARVSTRPDSWRAVGSGLFGDEQLVDEEPDRGEQEQVGEVPADVRGKTDKPSEDEAPDEDPADAVTRRHAHAARLQFE